jgi:hypothetical protein
LNKLGADAYMFLKFIRLERIYVVFLIIPACAIIPLNYFGAEKPIFPTSLRVFDMKIFALSNIYPGKNDYLWGHIIASWAASLFLCYLLTSLNSQFVYIRQRYFSSPEYQSQLHSRTLLLTSLPPHMQNDANLSDFVDSLNLGYQFVQTSVSRKVAQLPKLIAKHNNYVRCLETVLISKVKNADSLINNRPTHRLSILGIFGKGEKVDSINYYSEQIQTLRRQINEFRSRVQELPSTSIGFISYPDTFSAHFTYQQLAPGIGSKMDFKGPRPDIQLAPHPKDILWDNIKLDKKEQWARWAVFLSIYILILIFSTPLLLTVNTLLSSQKDWASIGTAFFTLAYMFISQFVLRKLCQLESAPTKTSVNSKLISRYYFLVVINTIVAGTLWQFIYDFIKALLKLFANNSISEIMLQIPGALKASGEFFNSNIIRMSSIWINQMSIKSIGYMLELLQMISLISVYGRKYLGRPTPRQLQEFTRPQVFDYPIIYANQAYYFTLVLIYGIISPFVLVTSLINFILAELVYKHQLMYVYNSRIETGGVLWKTMFNRICVTLILSQLFLLFVFIVQQVKSAQIYSYLPLPLFTVVWFFAQATWINSKMHYIDLDSWSGNILDTNINYSESKIDFNTKFLHPAFSRDLLSLQVPQYIKDLIPNLFREKADEPEFDNNRLDSESIMMEDTTSSVVSSQRTSPHEFMPPGPVYRSAHKNQDSDSLIELLDYRSPAPPGRSDILHNGSSNDLPHQHHF